MINIFSYKFKKKLKILKNENFNKICTFLLKKNSHDKLIQKM